jgi:hypothetical protein
MVDSKNPYGNSMLCNYTLNISRWAMLPSFLCLVLIHFSDSGPIVAFSESMYTYSSSGL